MCSSSILPLRKRQQVSAPASSQMKEEVKVQQLQEFTQGKYLSWAARPVLGVGVGGGVCRAGRRG